VIVWKALVRSIVEYGAEIWGEEECEQLERLQLAMGKRILRCKPNTSNEVVRGELGWWRMKARRDEARLRYWARLVRMEGNRVPKITYQTSRHRLEDEHKHEAEITDSWCVYTKKLLTELNMGDRWRDERVEDEETWKTLIKEKIQEREETDWKTAVNSKPKLRTYKLLKKRLQIENYLLDDKCRYGRYELTKLRGGTNRLRIEKGRYEMNEAGEPLPPEQRTCQICMSGDVEDESHFLLHCRAYADLRQTMWQSIENITEEQVTEGACRDSGMEETMNTLIGDELQEQPYYTDVVNIVKKYIQQAIMRRKRIHDIYVEPRI
jgi:hypothetical protein